MAKKESIKSQVSKDKEVTTLKAKIALLVKKYKEAIKQADTQEQILEYNRSAVDALPSVPVLPSVEVKDKETTESVVLIGSCWHIGETINKQEMGGLNEYNFDIFCQRFQFLVDRTITFTTRNMSKHKFEELHVFLTGDMVSGIIHDELEASNQLNIVEQAYLGALVVSQGLLELAQAFPSVIVTGVVGNHGRVRPQKYYKNKQTVNWDFVFYSTLALLLKNQKNISFNIPMSFWAGVNVRGWNFMIQHGDLVKSWGGIPFYGLARENSKWMLISASQNKFFNYFVASHFHTKGVLQTANGEMILNGSLKGGDEYAAGLGLFGAPTQLLFGVHQKYGKTWELTINAKHATGKSRYHYDRTKTLIEQS